MRRPAFVAFHQDFTEEVVRIESGVHRSIGEFTFHRCQEQRAKVVLFSITLLTRFAKNLLYPPQRATSRVPIVLLHPTFAITKHYIYIFFQILFAFLLHSSRMQNKMISTHSYRRTQMGLRTVFNMN